MDADRKHMKPLQARLKEYQTKTQAPWHIIEQDYILSWVLLGISLIPVLRNNLVFKGGTALRKAYFGNYRFSEDLDFTADSSLPRGKVLLGFMKEGLEWAQAIMHKTMEPLEMGVKPFQEGSPHPEGQEAFVIKTKFPWHRVPMTTTMVEITFKEDVLCTPFERSILHPYGEPLDFKLKVYPLEEVIAEKLRAILQNTKKLHEKGWARSRARDYYDIWSILKDKKDGLNLLKLPEILDQKCRLKAVEMTGQFFDPKYLEGVRQTWSEWLGLLVEELPEFDRIMKDLKEELELLGL